MRTQIARFLKTQKNSINSETKSTDGALPITVFLLIRNHLFVLNEGRFLWFFSQLPCVENSLSNFLSFENYGNHSEFLISVTNRRFWSNWLAISMRNLCLAWSKLSDICFFIGWYFQLKERKTLNVQRISLHNERL